jgi:glycogen debranching enzyme
MISLKNNHAYAILDDRAETGAELPAAGVFFHDMRHISRLERRFDGLTLIHQEIGSARVTQFWSRFERHMQVVLLRRDLELGPGGLTDTLVIENSAKTARVQSISGALDADFTDIFVVRGHQRRAPLNPVETLDDGFAYRAQDGVLTTTQVAGAELRGTQQIALAPGETVTLVTTIAFTSTLPTAQAPTTPRWQPKTPTGLDLNEAAVWRQAAADIESLLLDTELGRIVAAGIPNFVVPFGRDSLITAWLLLETDPGLAASVLRYLAARQGQKLDPYRDEEPGKIMHEHRESELNRIGELPFATYYGAADSTPLFLKLLGDYVEKTGDTALARELEPNWRTALGWIDTYRDGRGLINFRQRADGSGLTIQSWKDSRDSMSYGTGELATGALAVAEVQAYVVAAYRAAAMLSEVCDGPAAEAAELRAQADKLAERFDALFWMEAHDNYALGLDETGRQLDVDASDSGHLLWCGIVPEAKAKRLIVRLFAEDMWSGYGLRTLSTEAARYRPLSYHNGSVWPHDTALFAAGLRRYGDAAGVARVREALVALASRQADTRLPELVGGYARDGATPPLPYIESCRPQAWSAAAALYLLGTR